MASAVVDCFTGQTGPNLGKSVPEAKDGLRTLRRQLHGRVGAGAGVEVELVEAHEASEAASLVGEAHGSRVVSRK